MNGRFLSWLVGLAVLAAVSYGLPALLWFQEAVRPAVVVLLVGQFAMYMWVVGGLLRWQTPGWAFWSSVYGAITLSTLGLLTAAVFYKLLSVALLVVAVGSMVQFLLLWKLITSDRRATTAVMLIVGSGAVGGLVNCYWLFGRPDAAVATLGVAGMVLAGLVGVRLIEWILSPSHPVTGIARTVISEAIRMKIALVFLLIIALLVPIMPLLFSPEERLTYRMQMFMTYSTSIAALLLGLMTIFLACWTICSELKQRQIFLTMTKPVGRLQYLLGKWLGLALLNALLVTVVGAAVLIFAGFLRQQPATDFDDRATLEYELLVARASLQPQFTDEGTYGRLFEQRLAVLREQDPLRYAAPLSEQRVQEIALAVRFAWLSIGPGSSQTFLFEDVGRAEQFTDAVQLQLKVQADEAGSSTEVPINIRVNNEPWMSRKLVNRVTQTVILPVAMADADGNMRIEIQNATPSGNSISFEPGKGMEMLYQVGSFEANLAKLLVMLWMVLAFLGMLGLACGTSLGFPTACMLCLLMFIGSISSEFLGESLSYYGKLGTAAKAQGVDYYVEAGKALLDRTFNGEVAGVIQVVIHVIGTTFQTLVPSFTRFVPIGEVADGRWVPMARVGEAAFKLLVVWTGLSALVGWYIFSRRELARVIV